MPHLNILYIHSHDTGRYLQPYGYAVPTPNIQKLAGQGTLFRQAFCAAPTCSPSRAALLTGRWPHCTGMLGFAHRGFKLTDPKQHLVHFLNEHGYHTALSGVQHEAVDAALLNYREILLEKNADKSADAISGYAGAFLKRKHDRPFFLSVGYFETHREFPPPDPRDDPRYLRPPAPFPDTPETRRDMAAYHASARILDANVGRVIAALDSAGLAGNTLVISTTDHGLAFPGMKCNLTDHGIGVSLILRGPQGLFEGRVCDALVSHVDLFPTICDLADLPKPEHLQGESIVPLIDGTRREIREELFAEVTYHAAYEPQRCVRTKRWKYLRRFGSRDYAALPNCDDSVTKTLWCDAGWTQQAQPREALFDLAFDPNETCNVANEPGRAGVLGDLRATLDRFMRDTDDPLLRGDVPPPPGARVTPADAYSPSGAPAPAAPSS